MTAVIDSGKWCGMCKCPHAVITCVICCYEMHYGQSVSRVCSRCKAVLRTGRLNGIEPPHAPLTSRREFWLPVMRFDGKYAISNRGRIRNERTGKLVIPNAGRNGGYPHLYLCGVSVRVHALVLETWVGPRPPRYECLHHDDVKEHNHVRNLKWGTRSENTLDAIRNGNHNHARKSKCVNRHPYSAQNTRIDKYGRRICRTCERARLARFKAAKREQAAALRRERPEIRSERAALRLLAVQRVKVPEAGVKGLQGRVSR